MSIMRHNTHARHRVTRAHHGTHLQSKKGIHRPQARPHPAPKGGGKRPTSVRKMIAAIAAKLGVTFGR